MTPGHWSEARRAPPGWRARLAKVNRLDAPLSDRAHAARGILAKRARWALADHLARALTLATDPEWATVDQLGQVRAALRSARLDGCVVDIEGRALPVRWAADPVRTATAMQACERHWTAIGLNGKLSWSPWRCGARVCPLCVDHGLIGLRENLTAIGERWIKAGGILLLVTLTQRSEPDIHTPIVLTASEALKHPTWTRATGRGAATAWIPLGDAWDRWSASWDALRNGRAALRWSGIQCRRWWRDSVAWTFLGREVTSSDKAQTVARWHAHGHAIVALWPGVDVDEFRREIADEWCRLQPGALAGAQDVQVIPSDRVRQAVKYPGKLDQFTAAQSIEFLATIKGRRPHQLGGALHGSCGLGKSLRRVAALELAQAGDPRLDVNGAADACTDADRAIVALRDVDGALVEAWRILWGAPSETGDVSTLIAKVGSRWVRVTRARVHVWRRDSLVIHGALVPGMLYSDAAVVRYVGVHGWPELTRLDLRSLAQSGE